MLSSDNVDRFRDQWARELPELDTSAMAVLGRMNRISQMIHSNICAVFAEHGLDRGEFDVIATLRRSGKPYRLTPTELYTSLMLSSGGLTSRLARLEKGGLLVREPSKGDGRSLTARLTKQGIRVAEAAFRADMANELKLLDALSKAERETLARLLRNLMISLEARIEQR